MIINSLFLQGTEASGGTMNALGMQKSDSAGYLFSDIMNVHLGSDSTGEAGLSETITGDPGLFSSGEFSSLIALIQSLSGGELPEEIKSMLGEDNLLNGDLIVTQEQLENILAYLTNQPDAKIYGIEQISGEAVELNSLEEITKYLAEGKELFISAENGANSLKINVSATEESETLNGNSQGKFQISFNFEKSEKAGNNNSEQMQSQLETVENSNANVDETTADSESKSSEKTAAPVVDQTEQNTEGQDSAEEVGLPKQNSKSGVAKSDAEETAKTKLNGDSKISDSAKEGKGDSSKISGETVTGEEKKTATGTDASEKSAKVKAEKTEKVSNDVVQETEAKPETKTKQEQVNVSAKKSVKSDNLNINGKPIVTNNDAKPETNSVANNVVNSETAANMGTDSDSATFGSPDESRSHLTNMRNSTQETHHSTKFTDLINEKINKEQFLVKSDASKIVKAAELVKEISKHIQSQDKNSLTINIEPEHLGKVRIMMEVTNKVVKASIEVDTEVAKHMVETNIKELQTSTQKNGLELGQVNVSLSTSEQKNQKHLAGKNKDSEKKSQKQEDAKSIEENENQQIKNLGYNTVEYVA